jgi:hypothetical protein
MTEIRNLLTWNTFTYMRETKRKDALKRSGVTVNTELVWPKGGVEKQAFASTVINIRFPQHGANFLTKTHLVGLLALFQLDISARVPLTWTVLGFNAAERGNFLPSFRDNVSVPSSMVKQFFLDSCILEDGTNRLSRHVRKNRCKHRIFRWGGGGLTLRLYIIYV